MFPNTHLCFIAEVYHFCWECERGPWVLHDGCPGWLVAAEADSQAGEASQKTQENKVSLE